MNPDMNNPGINRDGVRGVLREFGGSFLHLILLLISAGAINWINAWVSISLILSHQIINFIILFNVNPELLNKRGKLIQAGTKDYDKAFIALYFPLSLLISIIAGLDAGRFELSRMPPCLVVSGIGVFVLACSFGSWAMAVNPHFETTVLIGNHTSHKVITSGPYKFIRHPGYAAEIIALLSYSFILGSWWGLVPAAVLMIIFVARTALEDRTLHEELPNYKAYSKITRYRLIPHVW